MKTERRVVNLNKEDFDIIKQYCSDNSLNMSKWIANTAKEKIQNRTNFIKQNINKCVENSLLQWEPKPTGSYNIDAVNKNVDDLVYLLENSKI